MVNAFIMQGSKVEAVFGGRSVLIFFVKKIDSKNVEDKNIAVNEHGANQNSEEVVERAMKIVPQGIVELCIVV